jgi:hypothetical protein
VVAASGGPLLNSRSFQPDIIVSDFHLRGGETGVNVVAAVDRSPEADTRHFRHRRHRAAGARHATHRKIGIDEQTGSR